MLVSWGMWLPIQTTWPCPYVRWNRRLETSAGKNVGPHFWGTLSWCLFSANRTFEAIVQLIRAGDSARENDEFFGGSNNRYRFVSMESKSACIAPRTWSPSPCLPLVVQINILEHDAAPFLPTKECHSMYSFNSCSNASMILILRSRSSSIRADIGASTRWRVLHDLRRRQSCKEFPVCRGRLYRDAHPITSKIL